MLLQFYFVFLGQMPGPMGFEPATLQEAQSSCSASSHGLLCAPHRINVHTGSEYSVEQKDILCHRQPSLCECDSSSMQLTIIQFAK